MIELYKIKPRKYKLLIYQADNCCHLEPTSYAWEITEPASDRPHQILDCSRKDFYKVDDAIEEGMKALFNTECV